MDSKAWQDRLKGRPLLSDHPIAMRLSLLLWALGGVLFIVLRVPALESVMQTVDDGVHSLAIRLEFGPFVRIAELLDFLGSAWVTFPLMIGVAAYLAWQKRWEGLMYWALSMVLSQVLIGPLKALYERPRPDLPLVETSGFSFPSGHAVVGAAIALSLVVVLVPAGPPRRNLKMAAGAFAVLMGLSRVYLRAHWLSDVVAGVALGAAVAVGVAAVMHYAADRANDSEVAD